MKWNLFFVMPWNIAPLIVFSVLLSGTEDDEEDAFRVGFEEDYNSCFVFIATNLWMYFVAIIVFFFLNILIHCCKNMPKRARRAQ